MKVPFLIIGGGLSGLAAGIRLARYCPDVLILEQHHHLGGLNSYFQRGSFLLETGLHAFTNFAPESSKKAPLNIIFRQLKLSRKNFVTLPQYQSEIHFKDQAQLFFSNDIELLEEGIRTTFPRCHQGFRQLIEFIQTYNPFQPNSTAKARALLERYIPSKLLAEMLLCPLLYYGSSTQNDMGLNQFVIMFRSIYLEGLFRPAGTMKEFLDLLEKQYRSYGGKITLSAKIEKILHTDTKVEGVLLTDGTKIFCDTLLSTAGFSETCALLEKKTTQEKEARLGFIENIYLFAKGSAENLPSDCTMLFYNSGPTLSYAIPGEHVDFSSAAVCLPGNFMGRSVTEYTELRTTHLANYDLWQNCHQSDQTIYHRLKESVSLQSLEALKPYFGPITAETIFQDTATPMTIQRYTGKLKGAVYGRPNKEHATAMGLENLFLAGTDQGFVGIIGAMLSGISVTNDYLLPRV